MCGWIAVKTVKCRRSLRFGEPEYFRLLTFSLEAVLRGTIKSLSVAICLAASAPVLAQSNPIEGTWRTVNGTEVTIQPCGTEYCGYLSWVIVPPEYKATCEADKQAFASQLLDVNNADIALKSRPIVGLEMMHLTNNGSDFGGKVYDPTAGKNVEGLTVWLTDGGNTLRIGGGCLGHMCIGTQDWPRVPTREGFDFTCG